VVLVIAELDRIDELLDKVARAADPDRTTTARAAELVGRLAAIERRSAGIRVLFADKAAACATWREEGHRSPAHWMAEVTRTGLSEATASLETSRALRELPGTEEDLRHGELSFYQASEGQCHYLAARAMGPSQGVSAQRFDVRSAWPILANWPALAACAGIEVPKPRPASSFLYRTSSRNSID
jgi:hypothetical protein